MPYGLDVVMPAKKVEGVTEADVEAMIPEGHRQFVKDTLAKYGVPELAEGEASGWRITGWMEQVARNQLDVAFDYPIKLLANALGSPPADVIAARPRPGRARRRARGQRPARRASTPRRASTSSSPRATRPAATPARSPPWSSRPKSSTPSTRCPCSPRAASAAVQQIAAALALGAQGVWLGSLWLTTTEADLHSRALTAQTARRRAPATPSARAP